MKRIVVAILILAAVIAGVIIFYNSRLPQPASQPEPQPTPQPTPQSKPIPFHILPCEVIDAEPIENTEKFKENLVVNKTLSKFLSKIEVTKITLFPCFVNNQTLVDIDFSIPASFSKYAIAYSTLLPMPVEVTKQNEVFFKDWPTANAVTPFDPEKTFSSYISLIQNLENDASTQNTISKAGNEILVGKIVGDPLAVSAQGAWIFVGGDKNSTCIIKYDKSKNRVEFEKQC